MTRKNMKKAMKLKTVVEGVETEELVQYFSQHECEYILKAGGLNDGACGAKGRPYARPGAPRQEPPRQENPRQENPRQDNYSQDNYRREGYRKETTTRRITRVPDELESQR